MNEGEGRMSAAIGGRVKFWEAAARGAFPRAARRAPLRKLVLGLVLALGVGALLSPQAGAYARIDADCILRVTTPTFAFDGYGNAHQYVDGAVDCGSNVLKTEIQAGPQVYNQNGSWYNCCLDGGSFPTQTMTTTYNELSYDAVGDAVAGHTYRTWDWGYVFDDGASNSYASQGVIFG
jgi:hypothetical protein